MKIIFTYTLLMASLFHFSAHAMDDPWGALRKKFTSTSPETVNQADEKDPWAALRSVYLPFSREEEKSATTSGSKNSRFEKKFNQRLKPFRSIIKEASETFNIPQEIIKAVIMAESGGDPNAKAKSTSAKGLMQTINATFELSRNALEKMGVSIKDNPYDPRSSILAGAYYLDKMYAQCLTDGKLLKNNRSDIGTWRFPLEYYYAGPKNGLKEKNKIYVFSNGEKRMIDKRSYSQKIQKWAEILSA